MTRAQRMTPLRLVIVTPLMPPAPGGGGIYTETIARALIETHGAELVCVVTEKHPDAPDDEVHLDGRYRILRRFPFRAGSAIKTWKSYLAYGQQNLQYGQIGKICAQHRATAVLIHSSLHNNPNLLTAWLPGLRRRGLLLVSDVRDPLLPRQRFRQLYPYHKILACSQSVANHLGTDDSLRSKLETVPIPVDVEKPADALVKQVLVRHSLQAGNYLLSTNGILHRKGLGSLLALAKEINRRDLGITIAIAGKERDRTSEVDALIKAGIVCYLGMLPHADVLSLSAAALANINLSPVEGMPRTTLETLAVGGNVVVTKGIPEFDALATDAVVDPHQPEQIADLLERMQSKPAVFPYDISQHHVSTSVGALHDALSATSH
jgi:glycosyltransferase involved in cell wall biosynthesis